MKKVLFETHHLYYWPNFWPIVEELKKRCNYEIQVSIPKRDSRSEEIQLMDICKKMKIQFIQSKNEQSRLKAIIDQKFDIIFVGNVGQLKEIVSDTTITIMVYHGIGLKNSYYNDIDDRIDMRAVESQPRLEELKTHGHKNLILTGYTKIDRLQTVKKNYLINLRENLNLDTNKKTVLYAPSFYPSSIEKIFPYLIELSRDFNVIIKLHAFSWEQKKYHHQSTLFLKLSKGNNNIFLLQNDVHDIIPYYLLSDILVTDISSTMFEYLPLDRPIIQAECYSLKIKHRILQKRFWKKMDLKRQQETDFVYNIKDPEDLLSRVYFAIENSDDMSALRKSAREHYLYKTDGLASYRLVDALESYNNEDRNI